jgi:hypothetical protein
MTEIVDHTGMTTERSLEMTAELKQVCRLAQKDGTHLAFVINHSGGKDSTGMMGLVRRTSPDIPTNSVMADSRSMKTHSPMSSLGIG